MFEHREGDAPLQESVMANFTILIHQFFPTVRFLNIYLYIYGIYKHVFIEGIHSLAANLFT